MPQNVKALVDAYINRAQPFAQPICRKLRQVVLKADPQVEEVIKWGSPVYQKNGLVCSIGAFKEHVGFWFFKGAYLTDPKRLFVVEGPGPKNLRSVKFTDVKQLDEKALIDYVKEAIRLNAEGGVVKETPISLPKELKQGLAKNKRAKEFFERLSYTNRKEYVRWIETARRPEMRVERLKKTIAMLSKGIKHP